jgi:prepilin-type N-terminal cleavage/methylation domain-containing protein
MLLARRRGFTVLELLFALGMLLVLAAIAEPRVAASLPGIFLEQGSRGLAAELELARLKAVTRNSRVRVVVRLDAASYDVEEDSEGRFVADGATRRLPGGVAFDPALSSRVSQNRISITFQPRGHTADNATIALAAGQVRRRVVVSPAGRVRIE